MKERDRWVNALSQLISLSKAERMVFNENAWLLENFRRADLNRDGRVSFPELWKLLERLNLGISRDYATQLFRV